MGSQTVSAEQDEHIPIGPGRIYTGRRERLLLSHDRACRDTHVWPTWLTRYLPRDLPSYFEAANTINPSGKVSTVRKKWQGDPRSRRAKCVCATCNNEWMSRLQKR